MSEGRRARKLYKNGISEKRRRGGNEAVNVEEPRDEWWREERSVRGVFEYGEDTRSSQEIPAFENGAFEKSGSRVRTQRLT